MKTRLLAATASLGAVALVGAAGIAGGAGASGSNGGSGNRSLLVAEIHEIATSGSLPSGFACSSADRQLGRIAAAEQRLPGVEAKLQAAATKAVGTPRQDAAAARLAAVQQLEVDLPIVANVITTACPGSSASSATAMTVAQRIEAVHALLAEVHSIATSGTLPDGFSCSEAPSVQGHLAAAEARINNRVATLTSSETAATTAGKTQRAAAIANRITTLTGVHADMATVSGLVSAACPA